MSELAWKQSPKFNRRVHRPMLNKVPDGFKEFLEKKIQQVPSNNQQERDHVVRRALALWRLCWLNVPDGWDLINVRLQSTFGDDWLREYEERNGKVTKECDYEL